MSGKGSRPRPYSVDRKTFESNWDKIFSKKSKKSDTKKVTRSKNKIYNNTTRA
jgi:hypothetical protein